MSDEWNMGRNLLELFAKHSNFEIKYNHNEKLNIQKLIFGLFDIMIYPVVSELRDSLPPLFPVEYSVYFKTPDTNIGSLYFLKVFEVKMWVAISVTLGFFLFYFILKHYLTKTTVENCLKNIYQFFNISSEILQSNEANFISYKLIIIFFSINIICMTGAFSGFLISHLSVHKVQLPFNTWKEILVQDEYSICASKYSMPLSQLKFSRAINKVEINKLQCKLHLINQTRGLIAQENYREFLKQSICVDDHLLLITDTIAMDRMRIKRFY